MSNDTKDRIKEDEQMICALSADETVALQSELRALPDTMPPRDVWLKIREQADAEGLLTHRTSARTHNRWYAGVGLAAAALMVAVIMPGVQEPAGITVPDNVLTESPDISYLARLQAYSRRLESDLRALPAEPKVARAGTVATMSEIEDRIAAIDFQLNDPTAEWAEGDKEIFWGERVRLMKLLLQLRFAQAQRAAF